MPLPLPRLALTFLAAALAPAAALADETWTARQSGTAIAWEGEVGGAAVLSLMWNGTPARLYVENLVGDIDARSVSHGYWIGEGEGEASCSARLEGPDGLGATAWGLARIWWDAPAFPSGFTALLDDCPRHEQRILALLQ